MSEVFSSSLLAGQVAGLTQGRGQTPRSQERGTEVVLRVVPFGKQWAMRGGQLPWYQILTPDAFLGSWQLCILVVYKYSGTPRCLGQYPTKWLAIGWVGNHSMWCKVLSQLCTIYHIDTVSTSISRISVSPLTLCFCWCYLHWDIKIK